MRGPTTPPVRPGGGPVHDGPMLTEQQREILEFERSWFKYAGAKETSIRDRFDMSLTRYAQVLNALIDHPEAMAVDAVLVKRLRRIRDARRARRTRDHAASQPARPRVLTMRRLAVLPLLLACALAGCSSDEGSDATGAPKSSSTPSTASTAPTPTPLDNEPTSLRDSCPLIERAIPTAAFPNAVKLTQSAQDLQQLSNAGDVETQNAVDPLVAASRQLVGAEAGEEAGIAYEVWLDTIGSVARRCKAVGSSALQ